MTNDTNSTSSQDHDEKISKALHDLTDALMEAYVSGALGMEFPLIVGMAVNDKRTGEIQLYTVTINKGWDEIAKVTGGSLPSFAAEKKGD